MSQSDLTVVKSLLDKDIYIKYYNTVYSISNLPKEIKTILQTIKSYYEKYKTVDSITLVELQTYFESENPMLKESAVYSDFFTRISALDLGNLELLADIIQGVAWDHYLSQIVVLGEQHLSDSKKVVVEDIDKIVTQFKDTIVQVSDVEHDVCSLTLAEMLEQAEGGGLAWRESPWLNKHLGSIKNRTLGHVFARPDVGKTAFAAFHAPVWAFRLHDMGEGPVLYLNNEEAIDKVRLRSFCAVARCTEAQLYEDPMTAQDKWDKIDAYIKFIGGVSHIDYVETLIKHFKPGMVIIDQGPKIQIQTKETDVKRLQILYNRYREMAKEYDTRIMCLGQADSMAEGRLVLSKNNLDNSKVGIPGECDWMLGIGMTAEEGMEATRCISICKNKLTGGYGYQYYQFDIGKCQFKEG